MDIQMYIIIVAIALGFSYFLTPLVRIIAFKIGAVDQPNQRKVHKELMPRMGGLAIYLSCVFTYLILTFFLNVPTNHMILGLFMGSTVIVFVGVIDDRFQLRPLYKLLGQLVACYFLILFDIKLHEIHLPFVSDAISLGYLSIPITILWVVGITNAVNLIDGLDGLAAGISSIAAFTFFVVSLMLGSLSLAVVSLVLFGSLLGFLRYNFHPAKIFMGDTGSLFLGFVLATISLMELKKIGVISFLFPIIILGIPIGDTIYAIIRRKLNRQPISKPDKKHLHHCLIDLGFSHRQTVLIIYCVSIFFSILAVISTSAALWVSILIFLIYAFFIQLFAEIIGMFSYNQQVLLKLWKKMKK